MLHCSAIASHASLPPHLPTGLWPLNLVAPVLLAPLFGVPSGARCCAADWLAAANQCTAALRAVLQRPGCTSSALLLSQYCKIKLAAGMYYLHHCVMHHCGNNRAGADASSTER